MRNFTYILLSLLLLLCACGGGSDARMSLDRAEALMAEHPDSALAILQGIDTLQLSGRADRALYSLLLSQALDKNYINIASDSIIAPAVEYYDVEKEPLRYAMSHYYLGEVYYYGERFVESMAAMLVANKAAREVGDDFWIAMTARSLSKIFRSTTNGSQEKEYAEIAYEHFKSGGFENHAAYALLDKGIADFNCGYYDTSYEIFRQAVNIAENSGDTSLLAEATQMLARASYLTSRTTEAIDLTEKLAEMGCATAVDSVYLSLSLLDIGKIKEAETISATLQCRDNTVSLLQYKLYASIGDKDKAMSALEQVNKKINSDFFERVDNDLSVCVIKFYDEQRIAEAKRVKVVKQLLYISVIAVFLVFVILLLLFLRYRQNSEFKKERYMRAVEEFKLAYESKDVECSYAQKAVGELMRSQNRLFDDLCRIFYEKQDQDKRMKQVYNSVNRLVNSFSESSKEFEELVCFADKYYSGLISKLRVDLPSLSDKDYRLYVLMALGFSTTTIALFIKEDRPNIVYNRKRHLKDKIKTLGEERALKYLEIIGQF